MLSKVKGKIKVAVLGYGSQGSAVAQNLRDSGYDVIIGLRSRSRSRTRAKKNGFKNITVVPIAVRQADIVCLALPDYCHAAVYEKDIEKNIKTGATLWFLHGLSVHFGLVKPPTEADVVLLAPHAPGLAVREKFLTDKTVSAFYAIAQNKSGKAPATVFALAEGIGIRRKRLVKTTFEDEAVGDIFGEQAVLCGGLATLIKNGFEVLVENGLKPENAYLEVAYQLDLIVQLIKQFGIEGMFERISVTARYGSLLAGPKIIDSKVKKNMETVLAGIKSGKFTRNLNKITETELKSLKKALKSLTNPRLEKMARKYSK